MRWFLVIRTTFLLTCSNVFMTFAWYSHLRNWGEKKWYIAAVLNWGIAFFEYLFQVPANHEKLEENFLFPRFRKANKLVDLVDVLLQQHQAGGG